MEILVWHDLSSSQAHLFGRNLESQILLYSKSWKRPTPSFQSTVQNSLFKSVTGDNGG